MVELILEISIWALPVMLAIILHEIMHGVVAMFLGDDTAYRAGRLTLNPIAHIDPIGTIVLPAILIFMHAPVLGWAKPVPVDFRRLRPQRIGSIIVAAAGPLTNLILASISVVLLIILSEHASAVTNNLSLGWLAMVLNASIELNVALAIFNLIPILPLDGGRVLVGIFPLWVGRALVRFEAFGFLLVFLLLYSPRAMLLLDGVIVAVKNGLEVGIAHLL
jgi:Zn-dependent protease